MNDLTRINNMSVRQVRPPTFFTIADQAHTISSHLLQTIGGVAMAGVGTGVAAALINLNNLKHSAAQSSLYAKKIDKFSVDVEDPTKDIILALCNNIEPYKIELMVLMSLLFLQGTANTGQGVKGVIDGIKDIVKTVKEMQSVANEQNTSIQQESESNVNTSSFYDRFKNESGQWLQSITPDILHKVRERISTYLAALPISLNVTENTRQNVKGVFDTIKSTVKNVREEQWLQSIDFIPDILQTIGNGISTHLVASMPHIALSIQNELKNAQLTMKITINKKSNADISIPNLVAGYAKKFFTMPAAPTIKGSMYFWGYVIICAALAIKTAASGSKALAGAVRRLPRCESIPLPTADGDAV